MRGEPVRFEGSAPIFRVEDMGRAVDFYVDKLGFQNAPWGSDEFTSVTRDRAGIYLSKNSQGLGGAWAWSSPIEDRSVRQENEAVDARARIVDGAD